MSVPDNVQSANAMLNGVLAPGEEFTTSINWNPASCGDFIAHFAVYDNNTDKNMQAETQSLKLTVEGCPSEGSLLDDLMQNIQNFFSVLFS